MKKKKEKNVLEGNTFNMSSLKEPKSPDWTIWSKYGSLQTKKTSLLTPFCLGAFDFDNETTNKKTQWNIYFQTEFKHAVSNVAHTTSGTLIKA